MSPEVYVSECCGGVFVPGYGPDNLHDAEEGNRLVVEVGREGEPPRHATGRERWERVHEVSASEENLYDAVRAGDCPCCGRTAPGLHLLAEVSDGDGGLSRLFGGGSGE